MSLQAGDHGSMRIVPPVMSDTRLRQDLWSGPTAVSRNGLVLLTFVAVTWAGPAGLVDAAEFQPCPFATKSLTSKEVRLLVGEGHEATLRSPRQTKKPNLCHAVLSGINMTGAVLTEVNLALADMRGANTAYADMRGANLRAANLSGATLDEANLEAADLHMATLRGADLSGANLAQANLERADLGGADLTGANLTKTSFIGSYMAHVVFEPATLPDVSAFERATGLHTLRYVSSDHALIGLRDAFERHGMQAQAREVTYAIRRNQRVHAWDSAEFFPKAVSLANLLLFEVPAGYGLYPGRPLYLLGMLVLVFTIPYMLALFRGKVIQTGSRKKGLRTQQGDEILCRAVSATPRLLQPHLRQHVRGRLMRRLMRLVDAMIVGLYVSLMSCVDSGWRALGRESLHRRVLPRQHSIIAGRWIRILTSVQAMISLYLIGLWLVIYFGRPFD